MTTLTTEQRDYMVRRLDEVTREKVRAKEVALFGEDGPTQPTWGDVFAAIKAGEIVLKEGTESLTRPYLMPTDVEWPALRMKQDILTAYKEMLRVERQRVLDGLVLGEAGAEALTGYASL